MKDNREPFLYDKVNKRTARSWFKDNEGNFYVNTDPHGIQMSGKITIISVANNPNYEVREYGKPYITDTTEKPVNYHAFKGLPDGKNLR